MSSPSGSREADFRISVLSSYTVQKQRSKCCIQAFISTTLMIYTIVVLEMQFYLLGICVSRCDGLRFPMAENREES